MDPAGEHAKLSNGDVITVNDHVVFSSPDPRGGTLGVGRVVGFLKHVGSDEDKPFNGVRIACYYSEADVSTAGGSRIGVGDPKLIYASFFTFICPLKHVQRKCYVAHLETIANPSDWKQKDDHYYFDRLFTFFTNRIFAVVPTKEVTNWEPPNSNADVGNILKMRYDFIVTEKEALSYLIENPRICEGCQYWCSKPDALQCTGCKKFFHPGCISASEAMDTDHPACTSCGLLLEEFPSTPGSDQEASEGGSVRYFGKWPYRYYGFCSVVEDAIDENTKDNIFAHILPRKGPQYQLTVSDELLERPNDCPTRGTDETVELGSILNRFSEQQLLECDLARDAAVAKAGRPTEAYRKQLKWFCAFLRRMSEAFLSGDGGTVVLVDANVDDIPFPAKSSSGAQPRSRELSKGCPLPADHILISFPRSDGDEKNWPSDMDPKPGRDGTVNYNRLIGLDEGVAKSWRVKIGTQVAAALGMPSGVNYVLESWPEGYGLFDHCKGAVDALRHDTYLIGSQYVGRFRSVPEFTPHAIWLFGGVDVCRCKYCHGKGPKRGAIDAFGTVSDPQSNGSPPAKRRRKSESGTKSPVAETKTPKLERAGVRVGEIVWYRLPHDITQNEASSEAPVAIQLWPAVVQASIATELKGKGKRQHGERCTQLKADLLGVELECLISDQDVLPFASYTPPPDLLNAVTAELELNSPLSNLEVLGRTLKSFSNFRPNADRSRDKSWFRDASGPFLLSFHTASSLTRSWALTEEPMEYSDDLKESTRSFEQFARKILGNLDPETESWDVHLLPAVWYGTEQLRLGDVVRIRYGRHVIQKNNPQKRLCEGSTTMSNGRGELERGLFLAITNIYVVHSLRKDGKEARKKCRVRGTLYELVEEGVHTNGVDHLMADGDNPPNAQRGYKFEPIFTTNTDQAIIDIHSVLHRYYPDVTSRPACRGLTVSEGTHHLTPKSHLTKQILSRWAPTRSLALTHAGRIAKGKVVPVVQAKAARPV